MPIPTSIADLSATASSNSPAGSESPTEGDNYIRALSAIIRQNYDAYADTASTAAGDALIGVKRTETGAVSTTLHTWIQGQTINAVSDFGADPTGVSDCASAINAALSAGDSVYLPEGTYLVASTITVGQRKHLRGAGKYATKIVFTPTADDTCIEISNGASIVDQGSVSDLALYSDDSTYAKVGIDLVDANSYSIERVSIAGSVVASSTSFWGGTGSIGIRVRGRQCSGIRDVDIAATKPIVIATNPNSTISIDHFNFHNLLLLANGNPCIEVLTGVNLTQVSFTGYQAWVLGTAGFKWADTTTTSVANGLRFENVRTEQGTSATDYTIDISHNYGLQNLVVDGILCDSARRGIKLRKCEDTFLRNVYVQAANEAFNVDATVKRVTGSGCFWQAGSTSTLTGQRFVRASPYNPSTGALPPDFYLDESANGSRNEIHDGVLSATQQSVANLGVIQVGGTSTTGLLIVTGKNDASGLFFLNGALHTVNEISDPAGVFSTTSGTASSTNVYWSAGNSRYELENRRGSTLTYIVIPFGTYS